METILEINRLSKNYGKIHALNNLSFNVEKGCIFGILGPNGCGKTTTLGIILDVIRADHGFYRWFGESPSKECRKRIGSILEQPVFYPYLSASNNLRLLCEIKGIPPVDTERVLEITGLLERKNTRFRTFSYGMKQRLAIAGAILGKPEVLIFDEPTNGLDPKGIAEIRELIGKIASLGITIILASHLLDEVQKICSHVMILSKGEKLYEGKVSEVLNLTDSWEVNCTDPGKLLEILPEYDGQIGFERDKELVIVKLKENFSGSDLNRFLFDRGISLSHLVQRKRSLEKQFLEILSQNHDTPVKN